MISESKQIVNDVMQDPKIAGSVMVSTAATGASEMLLNIPWPAIVTATGSILSIILGIIQIWRFIIDRRIKLLEERILQHKKFDDE